MKGYSKLQRGSHARTPKGFQENIRHMEKEGYTKKRAVGTAYGEADRSMDHAQTSDYTRHLNKIRTL